MTLTCPHPDGQVHIGTITGEVFPRHLGECQNGLVPRSVIAFAIHAEIIARPMIAVENVKKVPHQSPVSRTWVRAKLGANGLVSSLYRSAAKASMTTTITSPAMLSSFHL